MPFMRFSNDRTDDNDDYLQSFIDRNRATFLLQSLDNQSLTIQPAEYTIVSQGKPYDSNSPCSRSLEDPNPNR